MGGSARRATKWADWPGWSDGIAQAGTSGQLSYTSGMADVTTMKITRATRDRLRSLGADGDSLEDVVVAALDVYESQRFWAEAEAAAAAETPDQRADRKRIEAEVDAWMDGLR